MDFSIKHHCCTILGIRNIWRCLFGILGLGSVLYSAQLLLDVSFIIVLRPLFVSLSILVSILSILGFAAQCRQPDELLFQTKNLILQNTFFQTNYSFRQITLPDDLPFQTNDSFRRITLSDELLFWTNYSFRQITLSDKLMLLGESLSTRPEIIITKIQKTPIFYTNYSFRRNYCLEPDHYRLSRR
jgi:hypothetical protein